MAGKLVLAVGWRPESFIMWDSPQDCLGILTTWRLTPPPPPPRRMIPENARPEFQCLLSLSLNSHVHVPLSVLFRVGGNYRKCKKSRRPESLGATLEAGHHRISSHPDLDGPGTRKYVRLHSDSWAMKWIPSGSDGRMKSHPKKQKGTSLESPWIAGPAVHGIRKVLFQRAGEGWSSLPVSMCLCLCI